jgi:surfeit locus 1 family protein
VCVGTLRTMLRELFSLRLIASHLLVLAVAAGCVTAGLWQWERLQQVREHNALTEERMAAEPVQLEEIVGTDPDTEALEYRRVTATGTFRADEEVVQRNQSYQGNQGLYVLTPLELDDGTPVLVQRGWVPSGFDDPPLAQAPPPAGRVEVTGLLEPSVDQPGFGAQDPEEGTLQRVFHADTTRLDRQVEGELFPMVLRLQEPAPADGELPLPVGDPELDEANHFSYAMQWYSFALLALVTYGAWLVRRLRHRDEPVMGPSRETDEAPPAPADRPAPTS